MLTTAIPSPLRTRAGDTGADTSQAAAARGAESFQAGDIMIAAIIKASSTARSHHGHLAAAALVVGDLLALEDGSLFHGLSIGATGKTSGEVVFNTSMTGYQEILTDPSYAGQIITFTFPHIGNVGTNDEDIETVNMAALSGVRGVVLKADITVSAPVVTVGDMFEDAGVLARQPEADGIRLVDAGVTGILNFAPCVLSVPDGVDVRKVDLAIELQILSFHEHRKASLTAITGGRSPEAGNQEAVGS